MQDNAPIHTAKKVKKWFEDNGIPTLDWPPYSPDLNPIEHAWSRLKEIVHQDNPHLLDLKGGEELVRQELMKALEAAWESIDKDYFEKLVKSMKKHVDAVLNAKDWYT